MTPRARTALAVALLLLPAGPGVAGAASPAEKLLRVQTALAAHPDDPDLHWAHARALAAAGQPWRAARRIATYEARWPGRRPEAPVERARLWLEGGRPGLALAAAREAETSALAPRYRAHAALYRGLALRQLGRRPEAHAALARAAGLDPSLRAEVWLVRAVDLLDAGREREADALLRRVIALDPTAEAARRARLLLPRREPTSSRRSWRLDAYAGAEWDSNITLDNEAVALEEDQRDFRGVGGASVLLRWEPPGADGRLALSGGYRADTRLHGELTDYDLHVHSGFASLRWRAAPRLALRLDGVAWGSWRDGDRYVRATSARPQLLFVWGPRAGTTRLFGDVEWREFHDEPQLAALERDAFVWGGGAEHFVRLPLPEDGWGEGAWASLGGRFERQETRAREAAGFGGDYDGDVWEGRARLSWPLVSSEALGGRGPLELDADLTVARELYQHDNLIGFTEDGERRERRDTYGELELALSVPLHRLLRLELSWRGVRRDSNVDAFEVNRQVFGIRLRASSE